MDMEVVGGATFLFFHVQKAVGCEEFVSQTHPPLLLILSFLRQLKK
jgi:hypothetical protein